MSGFFLRAAGSLLLLLAMAVNAEPPQILVPGNGPPAHAAVAGAVSPASQVRFNKEQLLGLRFGDAVELTLPNATRHPFVVELVRSHDDGIQTWIASHRDHGNRHRAIVTTGPSGSFGVFSTPEGEFRLVPGEDGRDLLIDMAAEEQHLPITSLGDDVRISPPSPKSATEPQSQAEAFVPVPGLNSLPMTKAAPATGYFVDIMFVVTQGYANRLGANLLARLHFLVERANTAYADSEVAIRPRLVHHVVVNYSDATGNSEALSSISPLCTAGAPHCDFIAFNAATFGTIETLRTTYGADVVALMRDGGSFGGSGVAWLGGTNVSAPIDAPTQVTSMTNPQYMYSVTTGCVLGCESVFIHEVGHNMGNHHDRATSSWQAGGVPYPPSGKYAYGYAYCASGGLTCNPEVAGSCTAQPECAVGNASNSNNFTDIMAYFQGTTLRNYKFSNPLVTCAGTTGPAVACGQASLADTARWMNDVRAAMSAVRSPTVLYTGAPPGALEFTAQSFTALESGGVLNLTVSRVGGNGGAVSVDYATSDGTAVAGLDYTAKSGTLNWANGDSANKTISITIANDGIAENGEAFSVALSNPAGTAGVSLGYPSTVSALIIDPWPAGGVLPAGFSTPAGSAGAWAVATDRVYEGAHSLRSAQVYGSHPSYTNSDLAFTGNFIDGTLGFAYQVSSWGDIDGYIDYGIFEFMIDDVVVLSDTGESGWKYFAYPVSAGPHTLRWRFRNALPSACNDPGWSVQPPGGASCADSAWIDAVVLPVGASATFGVAPASLAFGGQSMMTTSPAQVVTVTNTTGATLNVTGVSASAQFAQANNCAALANGATCTVNVTFTPSAAPGLVNSTTPVSGSLMVMTTQGGTAVVPLSGTAEKSLITHYYRAILRRAPDGGGKTYWTNEAARLAGLGANVNEAWYAMASFFFRSGEYTGFNRDNTGFVTDLYNTFFNRAPDGGGLTYWLGQLSAGVPREVVLVSFMFSNSFKTFTENIFGSTAARAEVDTVMDFYRGLLGRLPDSAGFNSWVQQFRTAQCQGAGAVYARVESISSGFVNSPEYVNRNRTNAQYVGDLYNAFMRRGGDSAGVLHWINQLDTAAMTRSQLRQTFINTAEFNARVGAVVNQGCL